MLIDGEKTLFDLLVDEFNTLAFSFSMQGKEDFKLLHTTSNVAALLGLDIVAINENPKQLLDLIDLEDLASLREGFCEARRKKSKWIADFKATIRGEQGWYQVKVSPHDQHDEDEIWSGFIQDITEEKKRFASALFNKERLKFALEGSNDGVWDWNALTGKTFYSERSVRMLGYSLDEVQYVASWWDEKVHKEDQESYFSEMQMHMEGQRSDYQLEYRIQHKEGSYIWVLDRGKVMEWDNDGRPKRIIGTHSDITKRKQDERTLKNSIDIITEQNKRLLNFAHIVSHNLRNHVGNLHMTLDMMEEPMPKEEIRETHGYLRTISDSLSETMQHLNKVVALQVDAQRQKERLNLALAIQNTISLVKGEAEAKQAQIKVGVDASLFIDHLPAYLESILLNLISNALKYSDPAKRPIIEVFAQKESDKTYLTISDNGLGIDMNRYGHQIFGMYQKFHGNDNATGIGLFITKNQVEALGGEIYVDSQLGRGTTFTVVFR